MENTSTEKIINILQEQREFFKSGATLEIPFRKQMLNKLLNAMEKWESRITDALWTDLHKSYEEAYLTELSIVKGEIRKAGQAARTVEGEKHHHQNGGIQQRKDDQNIKLGEKFHTTISSFPSVKRFMIAMESRMSTIITSETAAPV